MATKEKLLITLKIFSVVRKWDEAMEKRRHRAMRARNTPSA